MSMTQMNVRLDEGLKRSGDAAFAAVGYTPTQVVRRIWERASEAADDPEALVALVNGTRAGQARDKALLEENATTLGAVDALLSRLGTPWLGTPYEGAPYERDYEGLRWRAYQEKAAERGLL